MDTGIIKYLTNLTKEMFLKGAKWKEMIHVTLPQPWKWRLCCSCCGFVLMSFIITICDLWSVWHFSS